MVMCAKCGCKPCVLDSSKIVDKTGKDAKVPMWQGVFAYFSQALLAVGVISKFGSVKHNEGKFPTSWKDYPVTTYANALGRHLMAEAIDGLYDPESGYLHAAHAAWNALARLELLLLDNPLQMLKEEVWKGNAKYAAGIERRLSNQRRVYYKPVIVNQRQGGGRRLLDTP